MAHTLNIENKGTYLHASVTGENTAETVAHYLMEVREACIQSECPAVFIEENLQGPAFGIFNIYEIIQQVSKDLPPSLRKIAFVNLNPEDDKESMHFAETVAINRGLNLRMFPSAEEAEKWIQRK